MARLLLHVEGFTERAFVRELLGPHLYGFGYSVVASRLIGESKQSNRRGGIKPWPVVRQGIVEQLRRDPGSIASTMVDFYGLPPEWPGRAGAVAEFAFPNTIERLMLDDVRREMGASFHPARFIPFVMLHEFEALLFSDCRRLAEAAGHPALAAALQSVRNQFASPEHIDDAPETAPSKRLETLLPGYQKLAQGTAAATAIGLDSIGGQCGHFRGWLARLESVIA